MNPKATKDTEDDTSTDERLPSELSYKEASDELDEIVAFFEQRDVDVDVLVKRLERATLIVDELDRRLRRTRIQVEELVPRLQAIALGDDGDDSESEGSGGDDGGGMELGTGRSAPLKDASKMPGLF